MIEEISIQAEVEQDLIEKGVVVDLENRRCSASLPFIADPDTRLITNDKSARKIFDAQVRKLSRSEGDRNDVLESEAKLQKLGYVDWLENLPEEDQKTVLDAAVKYFIPWQNDWIALALFFDPLSIVR